MKALSLRQRLGKTSDQATQGFTLIELLVVIVILGVLAAIALPSFLQQADKGRLNGAKTLAMAAARECQVWQIEQDPTVWPGLTTQAGSGLTITPSGACSVTADTTYTVTIAEGLNKTKTCIAKVIGTDNKADAPAGRVLRPAGTATDVGAIPGCDTAGWT
jgi:type IV pilus assembly protein PilA